MQYFYYLFPVILCTCIVSFKIYIQFTADPYGVPSYISWKDDQIICAGEKTETMHSLKILSYSLFGVNSIQEYGQYIKDVAKEAHMSKLYRTWGVRVYHEGILPKEFKHKVKSINPAAHFCNVDFISSLPNLKSKNARLWRFSPMGADNVDVTCIRDLDSPLLKREEDAVIKWLDTSKILHSMRDNPLHSVPILAGLWCFRNMKDRKLGKELLNSMLKHSDTRTKTKEGIKWKDQTLLANYVWPLVKDDALHHDAYLCNNYKGASPFPSKRKNRYMFVGCVRPCNKRKISKCPYDCRPYYHENWLYC